MNIYCVATEQNIKFITFSDFPNFNWHLNMADRKGLKDELQDQSPDPNPIEKL